MTERHSQELAKLHCLHSLFELSEDQDGYLADQLKIAIDQSIAQESKGEVSVEAFAELALRLCEERGAETPSYGVCQIDFRGKGYDPLYARQELVRALKDLSGWDRALLLVIGLRESICPPGRRFTARKKAAYAEAVGYIDSLAAKLSTPHADLTLLYV